MGVLLHERDFVVAHLQKMSIGEVRQTFGFHLDVAGRFGDTPHFLKVRERIVESRKRHRDETAAFEDRQEPRVI